MKGVLEFYSETGTEGGYWAFFDEQFILREPPSYGLWEGTLVYDSDGREGKVLSSELADGRPLPDPMMKDAGDGFVAAKKKWGRAPYGVSKGDLIRAEVEWSDGTIEKRLSDSLLVTQRSYEGLHVLKDGDKLTIYEKDDPEKVFWQGEIALTDCGLFKEDDAFGLWIHADQQGIEREKWARPFMEEWPAKFAPAGSLVGR